MAKTDRLDLRLTREQKALVERGAALAGSTVSGFAIGATLEASRRAISEAATLMLDEDSWRAFTSALDQPPDPAWEAFLAGAGVPAE